MHRLAQSPFPLQHGGGGGGGGGGVSRLWRSNCEPHCFSVLCNWLTAAGPVGGRLTKLENNEPAGKQYLDDSTARSLPFPLPPLPPPLITSLRAPPLPVFRYSARKRMEKNTAPSRSFACKTYLDTGRHFSRYETSIPGFILTHHHRRFVIRRFRSG